MRRQICLAAVLFLTSGLFLVSSDQDEGKSNPIGDAIMAKVEAIKGPLETVVSVVDKLAEITKGKYQLLTKISTVLSAAGPILMIVGLALSIITAFLPQPDSKELAYMKKNFDIVIGGIGRIESKVENLENVVIHEITKGAYSEYERNILGLFQDWQYAVNAKSKEQEEINRAIFMKQFGPNYSYAAWNLVKAMTGQFSGDLNNDLLSVAKERFKCNILKVSKLCASITQTVIMGVTLEGAYYAYMKMFDRALEEENLWNKRMKLLTDTCEKAVKECRTNWRKYAEPAVKDLFNQHRGDGNQALASRSYQALSTEFSQRVWFVFAYDYSEGFEKHAYYTPDVPLFNDVIKLWRESEKMFTVISFDRENNSEPVRMEEVTKLVQSVESQVNACRGRLDIPGETRANRVVIAHLENVNKHPTALYYSVKKSKSLSFAGEEGRYIRADIHGSCRRYKTYTLDLIAVV